VIVQTAHLQALVSFSGLSCSLSSEFVSIVMLRYLVSAQQALNNLPWYSPSTLLANRYNFLVVIFTTYTKYGNRPKAEQCFWLNGNRSHRLWKNADPFFRVTPAIHMHGICAGWCLLCKDIGVIKSVFAIPCVRMAKAALPKHPA